MFKNYNIIFNFIKNIIATTSIINYNNLNIFFKIDLGVCLTK